METESWITLIKSACDGSYNGQTIDIKHLTPILCYQYALQKKQPDNPLQETSEVDHILPKARLESNAMIPAGYRDALFNLELLPKEDNIQKKDRTLNEVADSFLRKSISRYCDISVDDFDKFSDISNIEELKKCRLKVLLETFEAVRKTELSN